jgi:hypothetical protein
VKHGLAESWHGLPFHKSKLATQFLQSSGLAPRHPVNEVDKWLVSPLVFFRFFALKLQCYIPRSIPRQITRHHHQPLTSRASGLWGKAHKPELGVETRALWRRHLDDKSFKQADQCIALAGWWMNIACLYEDPDTIL